MSQARLYYTKKSRKVWTCSSCRETIPIGSPVVSFAVGYRGIEQRRCAKPECQPTRAQRESSMLADVYAAIDGATVEMAESLSDLEGIRDEIAEACHAVADEYEGNPMYEVNPDLQERAETVRAAADELEGWSPVEDEPDPDGEDCVECEGTGSIDDVDEGEDDTCPTCKGEGKVLDQDAYDGWLETAKVELQEAIDGMELP